MKLRHEVTYPAGRGQVHAMLTDPAFRENVARAQGAISVEVTVEGTAPATTLVLEQVRDTSALPAIARKVAGETTRARVVEEWDGPEGGSTEITAPGKPTRARGTIRLDDVDGGTRYLLELDVTVKVPLVAGKLEKIMIDDITAGLEVEHDQGVAWLEGNR